MPESIVNQKPPADMIDRSTHAPGPWQLALIPPDAHTDPDLLVDEDSAFWISDGGAGEVIALVQITPREPGQAEANGLVMAAGPDMVEALLEVAADCYQLDPSPGNDAPHCRFCDHSEGAKHDADCVMQFVDAALTKAGVR
jgi:hypothetical protein